MINSKKLSFTIFSLFLIFSYSFAFAQKRNYKAGVDRWSIKTSILENMPKKNVPLKDLLMLQNPIKKFTKKYESKRIPKVVDPDSFREGDIISTNGWLKLVALEDNSKTHRDGDYHIQLVPKPNMTDSCFIVEVPYPGFISDPVLKKECSDVRSFIRDRLLKGKRPSKRGSVMMHNVFVSVTGQLFFDAAHLHGKPRGKRGMHSYTDWELHPVIKMKFSPIPKNQF